MNPKLTFVDFISQWENDVLPNKPSCIIKGQSLMNFLAEIWFDEYKRISEAEHPREKYYDCFYRDDLIPNTLKHLEKIWKND